MKNRIVSIAGLGLAAASSAFAAAPEELTGATADMTSGFGGVKTLVLSVVIFGVVVGYIKMLKKR